MQNSFNDPWNSFPLALLGRTGMIELNGRGDNGNTAANAG